MTALLTTLTLQVALNITGNGATADQGYVRFPDVHAAYKIHEELATWNEARERCMSEDAHLAIADSPRKIAYIRSMKHQSDHWLHVGIYKIVGTSQWARFDNGLPVPSIPWAYDNTDRVGSCAGISIFPDGLVDYPCSGKQEYFVCEIRITEDNNATESSDPGLTVTQSTPRNHTATLPEGYVAYPDVGAAYKVVNHTTVWNQARKLCYNEGAQLALIDSVEKMNYIKEKASRDYFPFVGIHRFDGKWVSVRDGAVVESIPWMQGEPVEDDHHYDCVYMDGHAAGLRSFPCAIAISDYYICELPIPMS